MRYVRQVDLYSCGPVSILNILKWAGLNASQEAYLPFLQFGCQTIDLEDSTWDNNGTSNIDFDRVLRYVGKGTFKVRRKKNPRFKDIQEHLLTGGAVALAYHWDEDNQSGEHFMFISEISRGRFICINDHRARQENTVAARHPTSIKKWLKKSKDCPCAWFLTKE